MADGHLENGTTAISQSNGLTDLYKIWHGVTYWPS